MKLPKIRLTKWHADVSGGHLTFTVGPLVLTIGLGWAAK